MITTQLAIPFPADLATVLAEWARYGLVAGHSARTIDERAGTITRLARVVDPRAATPQDLIDWLANGRLARSSIATYRGHLLAWYGWLVATGRRADNPALALPKTSVPKTQPRPLSPADVAALWVATSDPRAANTRAYVTLVCYGGLRNSEIAQVAGEDVHDGWLVVHGKGGRIASIPMHDQVQALADTMPTRGFWFPSTRDEGHVSRVSVGQAISRAMRRAGLPEAATPHCGRHFYATELLRAQGNVRVTQRALRHADIRSTAIYTAVTDDELAAAVRALPAGRPQLRVVR